jgi:hypothetical protein
MFERKVLELPTEKSALAGRAHPNLVGVGVEA